MSAHFILRYRGQPVRFTFKDGRAVWEPITANMASPFCSVADAWAEAAKHDTLRSNPEFLEIEDRSKTKEAA